MKCSRPWKTHAIYNYVLQGGDAGLTVPSLANLTVYSQYENIVVKPSSDLSLGLGVSVLKSAQLPDYIKDFRNYLIKSLTL